MRTFVVVSCLVAAAVAQFSQSQPLREVQHFQAISQPHLPQDTNVLHATQQFLNKFAELKALADAAPDPTPAQSQQFAPQQQFASSPHRFAPQQPSQPPPPHPANQEFDVTAEIGGLLARHHAANPTPAPPPAAPRRAPVQQHAPVQQRAPSFPTFNVQNSFAPQPQAQPQPQFVQASAQPVDPNVPTHNAHGQLINPKRFPGPLAHTVPAGVAGRVEPTAFTPEVSAAHRALASAHANILQLQAAQPRVQ